MPKTNEGKWSVGLVLAMFVLFVIGSSLPNTLYESVPAGDTILKDISARPVLAISMLIGFGAGISAPITGLMSIIKRGERAILVYGSTLVGAALTIYVIAELMFPH